MWKPNLLFVSKSALALALMGSSMAAGSQLEAAKLEDLATEARTPAQHAAVSRQFRLRAEALDSKAAGHEANVKKLTKSAGAMVQKWPGMATKPLETEREKAMEARRAARESRKLAEKHLRLSVEALGARK
ncbi:MAG: hypothetical protein IT167_08270 [Bryobacterales bacterium]|nr:hypothetical protein [Bryobacterales bacterium]